MSDITKVLSSHFVLMVYTPKQWTPRRKDEDAARRAEQAKGMAHGSINASVNLLSGHDKRYRAVINAQNHGRQIHNENSLAWAGRFRAVPVEKFMDYNKRMGAELAAFQAALRDLQANWDADVAAAKADLGPIANQHIYPSAADLASLFKITIEPVPIASPKEFPEALQANFLSAMQAAYEGNAEKKIRDALAGRQAEITEQVQDMVDRLEDTGERRVYQKRVFDRLIDSAQFLVAAALDDTPEHARAGNEILHIFEGFAIEDVRADDSRGALTRSNYRTRLISWLEDFAVARDDSVQDD